MKLHLLVVAGPDKGRAFPIHPGPDLMLGRCHNAYYTIHDEKASRNHCQVMRQGDQVLIVCNAGDGGTLINGERIDRRALKEGEILQVGETQMRLHVGELPVEEEPPDDDIEVVEDDELTDPLEALCGHHFAHYDLGNILGRGHSAAVYKATDSKTKKTVALKVLREDYGHDDAAVQSFARAMKLVLPLRHAHLIPLQGAGKTGHHCWVAMDYVDGKSMATIAEHVRKNGTPDWHCAYGVATQVARALDYAFRAGLVHGHVTPTNIIRDSGSKSAKLGDFMLTRAVEGLKEDPIEELGELLPDLGYLPPERLRGWKDVDARSDIYGLGATLYALLTGRPPFEGKNLAQLVARVRDANPEKPTKFQPATPPWFERMVLKMLAKKRKERYQSAGEVLMELEDAARMHGMTG